MCALPPAHDEEAAAAHTDEALFGWARMFEKQQVRVPELVLFLGQESARHMLWIVARWEAEGAGGNTPPAASGTRLTSLFQTATPSKPLLLVGAPAGGAPAAPTAVSDGSSGTVSGVAALQDAWMVQAKAKMAGGAKP
jgi:hypothetical protein